MIIIAEYKTLNYIFFYAFNLFPTLKFINTFYCISSLTLPIVFNKIFLSFILYVSSFFILFILLWSLFKCLLLLRSQVWPLLPRLLVLLLLESLTPQLLQLLPLVFLYTAKVHWLYIILQFLHLLGCSVYRRGCITTFTGFFSLVDPYVNLNSLVNKTFYIFFIFHEY